MEINADIAFVGAMAVSLEKGISTATNFDADILRAVIKSARKKILLCDSSKFGTYSYVNILPLNELDEIITDSKINLKIVQEIKKLNTKVTVV